MARLRKSLEAVDDATWRHTQTSFQDKDGTMIKVATEVRTLSRADLRSLSWERKHHIESPQLPFKNVSVTVKPDGIYGEMTTNEGDKAPFNAALPMPVFDGWIAGIAIAALPLAEGYWASIPTGTYLFQGSHHLTVSVVGRTQMEAANGEKIDTWEVNAEWVDLGSGDIYQPGAERIRRGLLYGRRSRRRPSLCGELYRATGDDIVGRRTPRRAGKTKAPDVAPALTR